MLACVPRDTASVSFLRVRKPWCEETSLVSQAQESYFFIYTSQELGQREPLLPEESRSVLEGQSLGVLHRNASVQVIL